MPDESRSESSVGVREGDTVRAPYRRPMLVELGSIRDLTLTLGNSGSKDNPPKGALYTKTSRGGRLDAAGRHC